MFQTLAAMLTALANTPVVSQSLGRVVLADCSLARGNCSLFFPSSVDVVRVSCASQREYNEACQSRIYYHHAPFASTLSLPYAWRRSRVYAGM